MNNTEYYLTCLMEECAEVQHATSKALRFGLDDSHPKSGNIPSRDLISSECGDILGVIDELISFGIIDEQIMQKNRNKKPERLKKYLDYAKDNGTINK